MRLSSQDKRLIKAANGRCFYCGFPIATAERRDWILIKQRRTYNADHKIPKKRGGGDEDENMVCACYRCNMQKGASTVDEFRLICGLRNRDLNYSFSLEQPKATRRDWLCVHTDESLRAIIVASFPPTLRFKSNVNVGR
jgi:5-methylcytosine-specific restriction endonuclease McrA